MSTSEPHSPCLSPIPATAFFYDLVMQSYKLHAKQFSIRVVYFLLLLYLHYNQMHTSHPNGQPPIISLFELSIELQDISVAMLKVFFNALSLDCRQTKFFLFSQHLNFKNTYIAIQLFSVFNLHYVFSKLHYFFQEYCLQVFFPRSTRLLLYDSDWIFLSFLFDWISFFVLCVIQE